MRLLRTRHPFARLVLIFVGAGFFVAGGGLLWIAFTPAPDLGSFASRKITQSTKIYDRSGETVLYDLNPDARRDIIPLAEVSSNAIHATIAVEDAGFYQHGGISPTAIIRAILTDLKSGSFAQGGSTITQQVVKNTLLTGTKSPVRKIWEWFLAWKLEGKYSKDQILELYLNEVPYGGTLYGIEAASRAFFGKSAKDLSVAEGAYLAALPQAPTYYSPYGNNRAALDARKDYVLSRMQELGYLTEEEYAAAKNEQVVFNPQQSGSIIAPHFVFYIRQYLEDTYGPDVVGSGLKVTTTLDTELQHIAEATVSEYALVNAEKFNASNAALVALDPKTGQILAMVGSRNYFDPDIDGNFNAVLGDRQPGSSFKPFVYAAALAKGFTRKTVVFDLPTQFSTACRPDENTNDEPPCYAPSNFDDKFRGPMTFTTALGQSINVPAVKVLYLAGAQNVIALAESVGIHINDYQQYGLSLALGAGVVHLLDLTNAYGMFANDGTYNPATGILKVEDASGNMLEEYGPRGRQVLDTGVARDLSAILSDNEARQPEYPPVNPLHIPGYDVAVKTGTTNDYRDAWTIGYTPSLVVGAWAGNNNNSPMVKEIAGYIVAPMWNVFMQQAIAKYPKEYFGEPRSLPDTVSPALLGTYTGIQPDGTVAVHDLLYWVDKNNPGGPVPSNPASDPQFPYWEYPLQGWISQNVP